MKVIITLLALVCVVSAFVEHHHHEHRVPTFQPDLSHRIYHHNLTGEAPSFLSAESDEDPETIAFNYLNRLHHTLSQVTQFRPEWIVKSKYITDHNSITHIYLRQVLNGLEISNADVNVNVNGLGRVISVGDHTFVPKKAFSSFSAPTTPSTTHTDAIRSFGSFLGVNNFEIAERKCNRHSSNSVDQAKVFSVPELSLDEIKVNLMYTQLSGGVDVTLVWHLTVRTEDDWLDAYIDSSDVNNIIAVYSWVADDGYLVYDIPNLSPLNGERVYIANPAETRTSPLGWLNQGDVGNYTTTAGNNALIQTNPYGRNSFVYNYRCDGGRLLNFSFPIDFAQQPVTYQDAALANLFYWNNIIHDIFYLHGFNEPSGNFQETNFNKGGKEKDAVQANAQDGSGFNNANFATPPDGLRPRMRMYLWNQVNPMLDGDIDSGIIVHEYGHGISNRLTGGPDNTNCLGGGQAGGMGEGWGDFWAILFEQRPTHTANDSFPMGIYAAGRGIRPFPYSGDFKVNPQTFGYINQPAYGGVHAKGSVWCETLFDVYWELIRAKGFNPDWYVTKGTSGNQILFQNVVDGLKLQPCNPNFVDARNAIIQGDKNNYAGENVCSLWRGFARRGLGANAVANRTPVVEDFTLPPECQ